MTDKTTERNAQKPSFLEVCGEMYKETRNTLSPKVHKEDFKDFAEMFVPAYLLPLAATHILPQVIKAYKQPRDTSSDSAGFSKYNEAGLALGLGCGILTIIEAYSKAVDSGNYEFLAIPLVTNLGSLVYESYNRSRNNVIRKSGGSQ